jgi:hypothetical protein
MLVKLGDGVIKSAKNFTTLIKILLMKLGECSSEASSYNAKLSVV